RYPPNVMRPGPRREAPPIARWDPLECFKFTPVLCVARNEKPAWLGACVQGPIGIADRDRKDAALRKIGLLPAFSGVGAEQHPTIVRAHEHTALADRDTLSARVLQLSCAHPSAVGALYAHQAAIAGADEYCGEEAHLAVAYRSGSETNRARQAGEQNQ